MGEDRRQNGQAGRQPTDPKWRGRAIGVKGLHPTWGAGKVAVQLQKDYPVDSGDWPSESVVRRFLRTYDAEADVIYHFYRWPESMQQGLIGWEAGAALFALQRLYRERGEPRPATIQRARWYWHLTLAAPDAPVGVRDMLAAILAATEILPEDARRASQETVEATIFYQPWASEKHQQLYDAAVARGDIKQVVLTLTADTTIDAAVDAIAEMTGGATDSAFVRRALGSLFEAWANYPHLSPNEALDAQIEATAKKGATE